MKPPKWVELLARCSAMDGSDGWPSFNKLITISIVMSYLVGKGIPTEVAIIIIASSFGGTGWFRYLRTKGLKDDKEPAI